ncbi:MAG: hypothetical protein H0V82_12420 [Candidatus Protochlamydia sp.]|nr:hypothetical protein [Candidatus Protochlamydia sp.]
MTTLKQIEANRRNAQHSTGPFTLEGKDKSSQNSIKQGLFSNALLITGEQEEEFNSFSNEILSFLMPQNGIESILVERIITCTWRLRRVMKIESDMMHESLKFDFRHSLPDLFSNGDEKIMALSRYEMILENHFTKLIMSF